MVGVMHWVQDCVRASDIPNHEHFDEETLFEALSMAQVRKSDAELVSTNSKAADPGKFKNERKWAEWEKAFINYLSVIPPRGERDSSLLRSERVGCTYPRDRISDFQ